MPPAIAPFLAVAGAGSAVAVGGLLVAAGTIAFSALKYSAYSLIGKLLAKKPGTNQLPINVTLRSTIAPRRLIFGKCRAAGSILFVRTSNTNNKYLWVVVGWAGHQCSALGDAWLDKLYIPSADINAGTGAVATASLDGKLKMYSHLGTQAQTADTNLDTEFAVWTTNHRLRGICYDVFRLERSDKAWPVGAPQMYNRLVDGALVYDPRLDSTNGGAGTHRRTDPQTWAFSRNTFLNVRHFLSGGSVVNDQASRLIMYGLKETDARIDDAYTIATANIADQSLSGANAPPSGAEVRYTCDLEASCDQPRRDILSDMLATAAAELVYLHGKWRMYAAAYDAPVHTFTQDSLIGDIETDDTIGEDDRFNAISALFIDSTKEYVEQTSPVRTNATYITQDAGEEKQRDVILRGVTRPYQAQRVTELMLRKSRQMRIVRLPFNRSGLAIAPYETFTLDHTRYGWSGRVFRCIERERTFSEDGGMGCMITAQAEASSVYTDLVTADYTTGTSVVNSVQSEPPDAPTSLTATSLVNAIQFDWVLGEFWRNNGISELWEYTSNTPFASATKIWEGRSTRAVIPKYDATIRYYWVRLRTVADQTSSTEPSGNGLAGVAQAVTDICTDPEFSLASDVSYWLPYTASGGTVTMSLTGGANGGKATLTSGGAASSAYVVSRRRPAHKLVPGTFYTVTCRWRRTATLTGASPNLSIGALRHEQDPASASTFALGGADVSFGFGIFLILKNDMNARTVNVWQEDMGTIWFPKDSAISPGSSTYVSAYAGFGDGTSTEFLEIDYLNLVQGIASEPAVVRYTDQNGALTPLASVVFFKKYYLDSSSNFTFELPEALTKYIGAKIWFETRNTGTLTVSAGSGSDTMRSAPSSTANRNLNGRGAVAVAECTGATEWTLSGDLA